MNLYTQWMTVVLMMTSGLILGLVFDSYRVVASQFKFSRWMLSFFDLLYWLGAMLFVFQMLVKGNQGKLRFYVLLGLAAGAWIYAIFFSEITVILVRRVVIVIRAVWRFSVRCVCVLILLPLKGLWVGIKALILLFLSSSIFLLKIMIQCLRPAGLLISWLSRPLITPLWDRFAMTEKCKGIWQGLTLAGKRITVWIIRMICVMNRFFDRFRRNRE